MEATFRYQQENVGFSNEPGHNQFLSFEEVLLADNKIRSPCKTVQHKSEKAKNLNKAPFKLSNQNPEECAQVTAYFGKEN